MWPLIYDSFYLFILLSEKNYQAVNTSLCQIKSLEFQNRFLIIVCILNTGVPPNSGQIHQGSNNDVAETVAIEKQSEAD